MEAQYQSSSDWESLHAQLLADVEPQLLRALHVSVHDCTMSSALTNPIAAVTKYLAFLGLPTNEVRGFEPMSRFDAARLCKSIAEFCPVTRTRQMTRAVAEQFAESWLWFFGTTGVLLANGQLARSTPPGRGSGPHLFFKDLEAGIVAVSSTRAGLFWFADDS